MSEYIKREDVERAVFGHLDSAGDLRLRAVPSADVVEVVRCKDCVHWQENDKVDGFGLCQKWSMYLPENKDIEMYKECFCCYGERKE